MPLRNSTADWLLTNLNGRSKTQLLTLYFVDSGAYSEGMWSWFGFIATEYDWIHENQST